jgi:hypothetical protein
VITTDKTIINEITNVIPSNRAENSGTVGDGEAVVVVIGVAVGLVVGVGVDVGVELGVSVGAGVGVGVDVGFTVIVTALEAGDVTGVEALSVTVQVTECEPAVAV